MSHQTLLLVDGNALLYRAYHAFPKELSTKAGEPIGAAYGFTRILLAAIKTLKPACIAVCFDLKGPTFRHDSYDLYKATRAKMPDDLESQIKRTHEIVEKLEFPIYTSVGYEADDVIGTLARQSVEHDKDLRVMILTGDQDMVQLVTDRVSVYSPGIAGKNPTIYTPATVKEKYGFDPLQMIEYKALRGDPSDNIPGVPGIGEVTAKKLIEEFHNIDHLYTEIEAGNTENIKAAVLTKLKEHKESAFLSKRLATIHTDAPIQFDAALCKMQLQHPEGLIHLFHHLGFKSLINELPVSHKIISEATDVFANDLPEDEDEEEQPDSGESEKLDKSLEPILREMEKVGVKVDCAYLKQLEDEFTAELEKMRTSLHTLAGQEFNPDSPQQVSHILYEVLAIPTTNIRKGKNGYTTDAATLSELADRFPIAQLLLQYRELMKLQTTYVKPLQELVDKKSRLHTSYAPDTATGRISSRNPNLQNIPIRSEQGRRLRKAFIADTGKKLVAADYSQIELRIAAHLSDDPQMKEAFIKGDDFHTETAERMKVDRRMAKILNFSILYGKGAFSFAKDLGITVPQAKEYIDQYFKTYKKLREYLDQVLIDARRKGYGESMFGRRREFPDLNSSNFQRRSAAEREALNMPIQGTGADILKMAMCKLADELEKTKSPAQLILTVHDELVLEVPENVVKETARLLKDSMTSVVTLSVPLEVHVKCGHNWAEMEDLDLG